MHFKLFFNIKNLVITFYIILNYQKNLELILKIILIDMVSYFITHLLLKLQTINNNMITHHILTLILVSFSLNNLNNLKVKEITLSILEIEISTIFLIFNDTLNIFNNSNLKNYLKKIADSFKSG